MPSKNRPAARNLDMLILKSSLWAGMATVSPSVSAKISQDVLQVSKARSTPLCTAGKTRMLPLSGAKSEKGRQAKFTSYREGRKQLAAKNRTGKRRQEQW